MSMYLGNAKFDREQLIFVVEAILTAGIDRVESALPPNLNLEEIKKYHDGILSGRRAAIETAGMALAIFWAQLNDDGIGCGDALHVVDFEGLVDKLVRERTHPDWPGFKEGEPGLPDCRPMAEHFVNEMFNEYL